MAEVDIDSQLVAVRECAAADLCVYWSLQAFPLELRVTVAVKNG